MLLECVGFELIGVDDVYFCCGLVGIYLLLQFEIFFELCACKFVVLGCGLL